MNARNLMLGAAMLGGLRTLAVVLLVLSLPVAETTARGIGGGGGRGGGGRGGGGARTPSMSRAAPRPASPRPQVQRPQSQRPQAQRPAVQRPPTQRPSGQRPQFQQPQSRPSVGRPSTGAPPANRPKTGGVRPGGGATRPGVAPGVRPSLPTAPRPGGGRPSLPAPPSRGELQDFLNLPGGRPSTLPGQNTRPAVERPATRPGTGRPDVGRPDVGRPGVGDRPPLGRPDFGNRPDLGARPDVRPRPPGRPGVKPLPGRPNYDQIRRHWDNRRPFNRDWWARYPSTLPAWRWHRGWHRYPSHWCWRHAAWPVCGAWFTWTWAEPVRYTYGTNVVYRDNYVYVDDQRVASAEEYYQQAETIAQAVPEVPEEEVDWLPLGVFAIAEQGGVDNGMLIQLAVSKEGVIAGTFYNDATDEGRPLEGMVDRETQRAAWKFADGKNADLVMETAIYNLTQDESTALVHYGQDDAQTWLMVRLPEENPDPEENAEPDE